MQMRRTLGVLAAAAPTRKREVRSLIMTFGWLEFLELLHGGFDEAEDFFPAFPGFVGGREDGRFTVAEFGEGFLKELDVFFNDTGFDFVGLGEDESEGDLVFNEPADKLQVDFLRSVAGVDEDESATEVFAFEQVFGNKFVELIPQLLGHFGIAVAGKIDELPGLVDFKEVDLAGTAGRFGNPSETGFVGEHVNQRGLSDIGATNESELRERRARGGFEANRGFRKTC